MAVRGCTFHLQTMTSSDWAHQATNFYTGVCGITKGCIAILTADKNISISKGYFYTYGRLCEEDGTSLIPVPTVTTTTHRMLVYEIDLSKINTKSVFSQGQYKIISAYPDYPNPIMENLDNGGSIFQMQFCTWDQSVSGITNFKYTAQPAIAANEILAANRSGWSAILATDKLTYKSASAPTFVCNTLNTSNAAKDMQPYISVGMKLKLTQDAVIKYFFVTAIDATSITLYGGTDYTLKNTAITNVCYSVVKSPYGFPMNPNKWSVIVTNTNTVSSVVQTESNQWVNSNNVTLPVPIGIWKISAKFTMSREATDTWAITLAATLSTNATSVTYWALTAYSIGYVYIAGQSSLRAVTLPIQLEDTITLESPVTFTILCKSNLLNSSGTYTANGDSPTILRATCAYL